MKKIMFLTGTRADFGHQKPLIDKCIEEGYDVSIFVTGMHMDEKYGKTIDEILLFDYKKYCACNNSKNFSTMDEMLASTIFNFSNYTKKVSPDLIVVFADRFEALAAAIVGALNNILTVHIQAGDTSGTIDDSMRHAISKLCHAHFVANDDAKKRLMLMGEIEEKIFKIGTPGLDILFSKKLPSLKNVRKKYSIKFNQYSILIFHPVTTEVESLSGQIDMVADCVIESGLNYIVVLPNNDLGSDKIFSAYDRFRDIDNIKVFPSIDHYDFLILLKNARFIIGNSSCGIIEAPIYGLPVINIGSRQQGRTSNKRIIDCEFDKKDVLKIIKSLNCIKYNPDYSFGDGHAADKFIEELRKEKLWTTNKQKKFNLCISNSLKLS